MTIDIEQTQTEDTKPLQAEAKEPETQPETPNEPENLDNEVMVKLQPILLDSAINAVGHTLAKVTKIDEMEFTEDEHKALVEAWTPLLPSVSPMTNAILVTVIILSGKALLYVASRKKSTDVKTPPPDSLEIKEAVS